MEDNAGVDVGVYIGAVVDVDVVVDEQAAMTSVKAAINPIAKQ